MSDKKEIPDITADNSADNQAEMIISASAADASSDSGSERGAADKKTASSRGRIIVMIILLIVIIAGGLAANGQLKPLIELAQNSLNTENPVSEPGVVAETVNSGATEESLTEPVIMLEAEPVMIEEETPQISMSAAEPEAVEKPVVSSSEANTLLATIDSLRRELARMEASQRALRSGLHEQQQMNLQVRLRWITDPASRLPQIQLAWEEISLMVNLTAEQRTTAEQMHALARDSGRTLRNWQDSLVRWADALSVPAHEDILPRPEHPWLAWLVGQFHLRQAPTIEARRLATLRAQLLMAARQLSLESWPEQGAWQMLHAELLLQIKAIEKQDASLAVELGLPDNFEAIQADINRMRETARAWAYNIEGDR